MGTQNPNCDDTIIRRYLSGDLLPNEEAHVVKHLDHCARCQQEIESLAASADEWNDVRRLLTPDASAPLAVSLPVIAGAAVSAADTGATEPGALSSSEGRLDFLAPTDDPEMLGRLGPYEIKGLVGQGGMGLVLKAYDRALQRTVAIKVLSPHLATNPTARRRFAREAQAAAAVAHEHVIAIHAVAEAGGLPYLVMPYMPGQSLQQRLDEAGPLSVLEVLRIGSQIAAGLAAAHAQGLVHRDIKPANILLEQGIERVAITDFGLARAIDDASLTRTGVLAGTPTYMSPEQARGEAVDHRADLFSLGSVMYAMCAGRPPFRAESTVAVLKRICEENPTPLAQLNADVPSWLAKVIERLHAKAPSNRFSTAADLADLLQRCLAHVQNPVAAPLPSELREPARRSRGLLSKRRLLAASCASAVVVSAVLMLGRLGNSPTTGEAGGDGKLEAAADNSDIRANGKDMKPSLAAAARPLLTERDYEWLETTFENGHIEDPERLYQWSLRLLRTDQAFDEISRNALQRHLSRMQRLERLVAKSGQASFTDAAEYYRVEAEKAIELGHMDAMNEQLSPDVIHR
jgi:serine/threonine-protein kinase